MANILEQSAPTYVIYILQNICQFLLTYIARAAIKHRMPTINRKKNEYHRHKMARIFDFCLNVLIFRIIWEMDNHKIENLSEMKQPNVTFKTQGHEPQICGETKH